MYSRKNKPKQVRLPAAKSPQREHPLPCRLHPASLVAFYCKDCKDPSLCVVCLSSGQHCGHQILQQKIARQYLETDFVELESSIVQSCDYLTGKQAQLTLEIQTVDKKHDECEARVKRSFLQCFQMLHKLQTDILEHLRQQRLKCHQELEEQLNKFCLEIKEYRQCAVQCKTLRTGAQGQSLGKYIELFPLVKKFIGRKIPIFSNLEQRIKQLRQLPVFEEAQEYSNRMLQHLRSFDSHCLEHKLTQTEDKHSRRDLAEALVLSQSQSSGIMVLPIKGQGKTQRQASTSLSYRDRVQQLMRSKSTERQFLSERSNLNLSGSGIQDTKAKLQRVEQTWTRYMTKLMEQQKRYDMRKARQ